MLNIQNCDIPKSTRQSTTSTHKKLLRDVINENVMETGPSVTLPPRQIKQIKLQEAVTYLQKKLNRQDEQIIVLSRDLVQEREKRNEAVKTVQAERQKYKKLQTSLTSANIVIVDLRKKTLTHETAYSELLNKKLQLETKIIKLKELLRKKQSTIAQLQSRIEHSDKADFLNIKQKQQLDSLRVNYIKLKAKQQNIENLNEKLKASNGKYSGRILQLQEQLWIQKQKNKRLEDQCEQLEKIYAQGKQQAQSIQIQLKSVLLEQNTELSLLRENTSRIQRLELSSKDCSVYISEIARVLKQQLLDKNLRAKVQKQVMQILYDMEEGWNKILVKAIAAQI